MRAIISQLRQKITITQTHMQRAGAMPMRRRRRRWFDEMRRDQPDLFAIDAQVVPEISRLAKEGFSSCILPEKVRTDLLETWRVLAGEADDPGLARTTGKAFMNERLADKALKMHPALLAASLEPNVLSAVTEAMGMIPHLESIDVIESRPNTSGLSSSQLWHYDVNDARIIKLFVYLEDCGPENGPFTFVPADASQSVARRVGHYVDDKRLAEVVPENRWEKIEGAAGTAFLIDTGRCYHFGSRCEKPRVAMIATYSSGLKFMRRASLWGEILEAQPLSPLQRAVCGIES
jgi:hypothetical protein